MRRRLFLLSLDWYDKFRTGLDALSRRRRVASANRLTSAQSHALGLQNHVALVALAVLRRRELDRPLAGLLPSRVRVVLLRARQALQFHRGADG